MLPQSLENSAKEVPQGNFAIGSKIESVPKPPHIVANFMFISYLKTVSHCRPQFSYSELICKGHFWTKKKCHTAGRKKIFRFQIFRNRWRIDILNLLNQHTKFRHPTLPRCRVVLPQSLENLAKGVPQENFAIGSKIKFVPKPPHIVANFMLKIGRASCRERV